MQYLLYAITGIFVGAFSGLCGVGGAILLIPALIYFFHYSQHDAQGTSLAVLLPPIGILAAYKYWQSGHVHIIPAIIIAIAFLIGAYFGACGACSISAPIMKKLFAGVLILTGITMLFSK